MYQEWNSLTSYFKRLNLTFQRFDIRVQVYAYS